MKWLLLIALLGFSFGCEECTFCGGERVIYASGVEVQREELPTTRYCDELLEELRANPVDTSFAMIDTLGEVMVVTNNECF